MVLMPFVYWNRRFVVDSYTIFSSWKTDHLRSSIMFFKHLCGQWWFHLLYNIIFVNFLCNRLKYGFKHFHQEHIPQFTDILVKKFLLFKKAVALFILHHIHMGSTLESQRSTLSFQTAHFIFLSTMLIR